MKCLKQCIPVLMIWVALAATVAQAASPRLTAIRPRGAQRGTEVTITLRGERLHDALDLVLYSPGIEVVSIETVDRSRCRATLKIADDSPLGLHAMRVRTATGVSDLRTFSIGALPETEEQEPNNSRDAAQSIELDVTINGIAQNEDVDYYRFTAREDDRVTAEIEGLRLGDTLFDPFVAILDAGGFEIASSDDSALLRQDPLASAIIPEDGEYFVQVRESAYRGNGNCHYRLHLGRFPRPTALLPAGGQAGETINATLLGDLRGRQTRTIALTSSNDRRNSTAGLIGEGIVGAFIDDELGIGPSPVWLRVADLDSAVETEPNENVNAPDVPVFAPPIALHGVIDTAGDRDRFVFTAKKDRPLIIEVFARRLRSPLDAVVGVNVRGGRYLAGNDDDGGPDSRFEFRPPEDGEYMLTVRDHLNRGGADFTYRLEIAPPRPSVHVHGPRLEHAIAVPRGGRTAMLLTAERRAFGGPLAVNAHDLPDGVSFDVAPVHQRVSAIPIVLEATEEAPLGHSLADVRIAHADPERNIAGGFRQDVELVLGRNRVVFWAHTVDRLPVVVTEAAPFSIDAIVPQAPLVRNGTMQLRVVADRAEGYDGPIRLTVPFVPPGVSAARTTDIPQGQTEARITINANGNALLGEWKMVVLAQATVPGGGQMRVASQLLPITVAEPLITAAAQATDVDQGDETAMFFEITPREGFTGSGTIELRGLPHNVTSEQRELTSELREVTFPIRTQADSPPGRHRNLFAIARVMVNDEPVLHRLGAAELRINKPVPTPEVQEAPPPPPASGPEAKEPPKEKPPTRLEKLRRQHEERKKALERKDSGDSAGATSWRSSQPARPFTPMTTFAGPVPPVVFLTAPGASANRDHEPSRRPVTSIAVYPSSIDLHSARDAQRIVVVGTDHAGVTVDVTDRAALELADAPVAKLIDHVVHPLTDGETALIVRVEEHELRIPVRTRDTNIRHPLMFRRDIMPILMSAGCNTGACHGSARGQDGFRLSLFGYDPAGDYDRLTRELPGRRINLAIPEDSLVLEKAIGAVPHTGGTRFEEGSASYEAIRQWISRGAQPDPAEIPRVTRIEMYPPEMILAGPDQAVQCVVLAFYTDGTSRDVTNLTVFRTNNEVAAGVESGGAVRSGQPGEAFVTASFDTFSVGSPVIVLPRTAPTDWTDPAAGTHPASELDALVETKLRKLRITPSPICSDEEFVRRVYLDVIGLLPALEEREAFLTDGAPDKRARLIDTLVERREFSELWVMQWAELLQIRSNNDISQKAALRYFEWVRNAIASNVPIDEMVRRILTATGGTFTEPATNFYQNNRDTLVLSENVAQAFLGIRIQCAQCHNHPFDQWTQDDYYGFAAFLSQVGRKRGEDPRETIVFNRGRGEVDHPVGGRVMPPRFLGGDEPDVQRRDRRTVLAEWIASPDNPWFTRSLANRVWAHFMGAGIVEPVDDFRISNPPSNGPLLDALAERLVAYDFDFKQLVRDICNSRTYQRSTQRTDSNRHDETNFAHGLLRRLRAETLLDVVCQVTDVPEKFTGLPRGARAVEIADGTTNTYFLRTFGRAPRDTVCACEVSREPSLSQALHLLNGATITQKINQSSVIADALAAGQAPDAILHGLFVRTLGRAPTEHERMTLLASLDDEGAQPRAVLDDIFWALLNSREFIFNH